VKFTLKYLAKHNLQAW